MRLALAFAVVALAAIPIPALSARMAPGLWSLYIVADVDGQLEALPEVTECVAPKDAEDDNRILPRPQGKCSLTNVQHGATQSTYDLACLNGSPQSRGRAEVRFAGERYDGTVVMAVTERGRPPQKMIMRVAAKRLGRLRPSRTAPSYMSASVSLPSANCTSALGAALRDACPSSLRPLSLYAWNLRLRVGIRHLRMRHAVQALAPGLRLRDAGSARARAARADTTRA